jgi:hypothetical protein
MTKIITGTLLTCALATAGGDIAPVVEEPVLAPVAAEESSAWEQQLVIYGWLPTFDGTLKYQIPGEPEEESDFSAIDNLDAVFMAAYEVRKDKWSFLTDVIYLGMSGGETVGSGTLLETAFEEEFTAWLLSFYGGYNTIETGNTTLEIIAGMRYFSIDVDAKINLPGNRLPTISLSPSVELYDAVIGIKGRVDINENWYIPYLFDIGGGDSDLTWQGQASIGYRFGWGDVLATYRYVHYEKDGLNLVEDFDLYGPKVGVVFHF